MLCASRWQTFTMKEKKDSNKEKFSFITSFFGKLSIISIILTGIGIIINNIYLRDFDIIDFNLLQPRNIFAGINFTIYLLLYFVVFQIKLNVQNLKRHSYFKIVFHLLIKYSIIISAIFYLLIFNKKFVEYDEYKYLQSISMVIPISFLLLYGHDSTLSANQRKSLFHRINFPIFNWLLTISAIVSFFLSFIYIPKFGEFVISQLVVLSVAIGLFISFKTVQTKTELAKESNKEYEHSKSIFTDNRSNYDHPGENFFYYLIILFFTVYIMHAYSTHIHPKISTNFGGAKKYEITLELSSGNKVSGDLIFQNDNKYYIKKNTSYFLSKKKM